MRKDERECIQIVYSCNDAYIKQAGVSLISLFETNSSLPIIEVSFIGDTLSQESIEKIKNIGIKYRVKIAFYELKNIIPNILKSSELDRHPLTIYSKIFVNKIARAEKILYIDCDCIICNSLGELLKIDFSNNCIAGVQMPYSNLWKEKNNISSTSPYICDGVVLFYMPNWKKYRCEEKSIKFINKYQGHPPNLSEGTLNYVCQNQIYLLAPEYNLMSTMLVMNSYKIKKLYGTFSYYTEEELIYAKQSPKIVHYLNELFIRPWFRNSEHPKKLYYLQYYYMSPWKKERLKKGKFNIKHRIHRYILQFFPTSMLDFYLKVFKKKRLK